MFDPVKYVDGEKIALEIYGLIYLWEHIELGDSTWDRQFDLIKKIQDIFTNLVSPSKLVKTRHMAQATTLQNTKAITKAVKTANKLIRTWGFDVAITWREGYGYQWRAKRGEQAYRSHYKYTDKDDMSY